MKKIPILISTLIFSAILGALFSEKTHALYTDEKGQTWWSVAELLEYKKEVDADEQKYCSKYDFECTEQYRLNRLKYDENYIMLRRFQSSVTLVTGFNLKEGTIKLYISNERRLSDSATYGATVYKFAAAWFDDQEASDNFHIAFRKPEQLLNNEVPGTHAMLVFYGDEAKRLVKEQEIEYKMLPGSNIGYSGKGSFKYSIETSIFNSSTFTSNYSKCTYEKNYPNGECLLMFSPSELYSKWMFFGAPDESSRVIEESSDEETEETAEDESTDEGDDSDTDEELISDDESLDGDSEDSNELEPNDEAIENKSSEENSAFIASVKAPDTGEFTSVNAACSKTVDFPWWIVGLIVLGDLAALWLFFPRKNRA